MPEQENNTKQILLIIMSLVFLVVTYFVFSKYVFKSDMPSLNVGFVERENTEAKLIRIKSKTKNIKLIDSEIFTSDKFKSLVEPYYKVTELKDFNRGKENPFEQKVEIVKEVEKKSKEGDNLEKTN